jgi:hypothetical protein
MQYCLENGIVENDEVKARELYLLNWEENLCRTSLQQYVDCLEDKENAELLSTLLRNID